MSDPDKRVYGEPLPDPQPSQEVMKSLTDTVQFKLEIKGIKETNQGIKQTQSKIFDKMEKLSVKNASIDEKLTHIQNSHSSLERSLGLEAEANRAKLEEVKEVVSDSIKIGDKRKVEIIDSFSDKMEETHLKVSDIIKIDRVEFQKAQDERDAEIEAREIIKAEQEQNKQEALAEEKREKKKTRNKIFVLVVSSLIISVIGFAAMIAWLGFKAYLKHELRMTDMKQEIKSNGK